mmetsp:Transcript_77483/g.169574  ORF Transcript_77483/g.169574 Transcript_77483/m.169574 type:complete len:243 (+) Transcript_77483:612-1340(+)
MAASHASRDVVVNSTDIVLEVGVDSEGCLNRASLHDHLLNLGLAAGSLNLALEAELVILEVLVLAAGRGIAGARAARRALGGAARLALGRVRVLALRAMVVAVRQGEVGAHALAERSSAVVLPTGDSTPVLDEGPGSVDHATATTIEGRAEADILGREGQHDLGISGDAHTVRSCLSAGKCPTAATVGLIANVANDLGTLRPVLLGVEVQRNSQERVMLELANLAAQDSFLQGLLPAALHAA